MPNNSQQFDDGNVFLCFYQNNNADFIICKQSYYSINENEKISIKDSIA